MNLFYLVFVVFVNEMVSPIGYVALNQESIKDVLQRFVLEELSLQLEKMLKILEGNLIALKTLIVWPWSGGKEKIFSMEVR